MRFFFWAITLLASCIALFLFVGGLAAAKGAPQEASAAAMAIAVAVIPYVFSRAAEILLAARDPEQMQAKQLAALVEQNRLLLELINTVTTRR